MNLPFWGLENCAFSFVRGMDTTGTSAHVQGCSNTEVAVLWMCYLVTNLRAVRWYSSCNPSSSCQPQGEGFSQYGIQDSWPVTKGVTTTVRVLMAQVLPLLCPLWGRLVIHMHSWHVHGTEPWYRTPLKRENLFFSDKNKAVGSLLCYRIHWMSHSIVRLQIRHGCFPPSRAMLQSPGGSHGALET